MSYLYQIKDVSYHIYVCTIGLIWKPFVCVATLTHGSTKFLCYVWQCLKVIYPSSLLSFLQNLLTLILKYNNLLQVNTCIWCLWFIIMPWRYGGMEVQFHEFQIAYIFTSMCIYFLVSVGVLHQANFSVTNSTSRCSSHGILIQYSLLDNVIPDACDSLFRVMCQRLHLHR
jgi:hypothetical protein